MGGARGGIAVECDMVYYFDGRVAPAGADFEQRMTEHEAIRPRCLGDRRARR